MDHGRPAPVNDRVLDAAAELFVTSGYRRMRMQEVADLAGVSRQTVYNVFGDKPGLARAVIMRQTSRFLDGVDARLGEHPDLSAAVAAAVAFALDEAADDPLLKSVLTGDGNEDLLPLVTTRAEPQLYAARARIGARVRALWPQHAAGDVEIIVDATVRLVMSHMMLPGEPACAVADRLAAIVTGFLGRKDRPT